MALNLFEDFFDQLFSEIFNSSNSFFSPCKSTEYGDFHGDNIFASEQFKNVVLYLLIFVFFNIQMISYFLEYYNNNIDNIRNMPLDVAEPNQENPEEWKHYLRKLIRGNEQMQNNPPLQ